MNCDPRIYVGTYANYNSGSIKAAWIDLDDYAGDKDKFLAACAKFHHVEGERDPELMFQDFEGFPREFYSESSVPDELFEWLNLGEDDREMVARYADTFGAGYDITLDTARGAYAGTAESGGEFAERIADEMGALPDDFPVWIVVDWEASWNCSLRHYYATSTDEDGTMWFFYNT